jgi:hypothetical protein
MAFAQEGKVIIYNPVGDAGELIIDGFHAKYPDVEI